MCNSSSFRVASFDTRAAVEAATMVKAAIDGGDKKLSLATGGQQIKFDRQIIAIARVEGASRIYSNDPDFKKLVGPNGPQVLAFSDLPNPPEEDQRRLDFDKDEDE